MGLIFNTIETISFCQTQNAVSFSTILQSYFNIITVFSLYSFIILLFYVLVGLLHRKSAQILISVLFSILTLLEIGLYIYSQQTGALMGAELIIRPISETLATIRNSSNIFINSVLIFMVVAVFMVSPFLLKKIKIFNKFRFSIVTMLLIGVFSALTVFYQKTENHIIKNYIESKSFYFFSSVKDYLIYSEQENIEQRYLLQEYIDLYNNNSVADADYPMERPVSEFPDVLSPYFEKSEKQHNIVIILVESLGDFFLGDKGNHISFTPFLDSLTNVGLYWKNCLSTTSRTYGVLPSVIGSVPHGPRGFQFGVMPQHHSLFSLLNKNEYATNFYYGGDLSFDSMLDFLSVQDPEHIADFLPEMKSYKEKNQANWWGLYDHVLFEESINYLKSLPKEKPSANVYLTLSTHETFSDKNKELKEFYETKAEKIFSKLDKNQRNYFSPVKDKIAAYLYTDDCIRGFIHDYSQQIDSENTIFFITGDHSVNIFKNNLSYYSVPLIIWSPLLKHHQKFPNIVSHLSITPSIISYLQHSYNLKIPDKLAWCSMGLDTSSVFSPSEKILFLSYDRKVNEMIYNQYYFIEKDKKMYEIDENLDLKEVDDALLRENIYSKFYTLKYVNNYVYLNDKLIKTNNTANEYKLIGTYTNNDTIICKTPDTIPSIAGIDKFDLMPIQKITDKHQKIKIKLMADVVFNDLVYQDYQMMLNIICSGKKTDYVFKDHITKYIAEDNIIRDKKYNLLIEREVNVKNADGMSVYIYVSTNESDSGWKPDKKFTVSNIKVLIYEK